MLTVFIQTIQLKTCWWSANSSFQIINNAVIFSDNLQSQGNCSNSSGLIRSLTRADLLYSQVKHTSLHYSLLYKTAVNTADLNVTIKPKLEIILTHLSYRANMHLFELWAKNIVKLKSSVHGERMFTVLLGHLAQVHTSAQSFFISNSQRDRSG